MELEDAVTAHPDKCLRALAMSWGLQQTALEQLGEPSRQEGRRRRPFRQEGRLGKRKADTDNGSRRVRAREGQDNDSATGSESASSQDVDNDDKRSQQSRVVSVQMRVPSHLEARYGDLVERLMAAAADEDRRRNHRGPQEDREPSEHTRLEWRGGSFTTTERQRQQGVRRLMRQLCGQE